ncbi:aryl-sulfate sulfotransferase [Campylobacter jejuni]
MLYLYISVFDNGDSRGAEQPVFASQKYFHAVIYKIDQQNKNCGTNLGIW